MTQPKRKPRQSKRLACAELIGEAADGFVFLDGHDDAILGVASVSGQWVVVYDVESIIELLRSRDGMELVEAVEFFDFNIADAFIGPGTPVYVWRLRKSPAEAASK